MMYHVHDIKNLYVVQFQTVAYCNRKCPWCPNSYIENSIDKVMSEEVYDRVIDQLKAIEYKNRIHPYLQNEPLADGHMPEVVKDLRREFPGNRISLTTNGDFLTGELAMSLMVNGLNDLYISHYDGSNKHLRSELRWHKGVVHNDLSALRLTFYNRGGNIKVENYERQEWCNWPENKAAIDYLGNVLLCCSDYKKEVILGNVMKQDLIDIWNNETYKTYRESHRLHEGHKLKLCKTCNRIKRNAQ